MPVPESAVFTRLRGLVAVEESHSRPDRTITEVYTGASLGAVPVADVEDVRAAFEKAHAAQVPWAKRPASARSAMVERFRALVLENLDFLMNVIQAETGKARWAAQEEVLGLAVAARYFAKNAPTLLAPRRVPGMLPVATKTVVHYQPKGVVGVISPWNYPMLLAVGDALPALLAGNAVVIKPDSQTPFSALAATELLYRAGVPRNLLAIVTGPGSEVGAAIVDNCDYLMFTGSSATGRALAEQCGRRLTGFSAELGGKNPMIVTRGANLDRVAKAAVRACFSNAGQLCISIERIYVERAVVEEFTRKFVAAVTDMTLGAAYDYSTDMGSLISTAQLETVSKHVADATAKGAVVLTGGSARPDLGPLFFEPTVLSGVTDEMECGREETFGPLVAIYPVADVDEAVTLANDTEYGLNASVWAADTAEGEAIAVRIRSGTVNVDEGYAPAWGSTAAPMGGMGSSGVGRRHGPDGLLKFTEPQSVVTTRIKNLDAPAFLSEDKWQQAVVLLTKLVGHLPGR